MAREPEVIAELRRTLGDRLAVFRQAAGLTQAQLAQATICDRTTVAHIEKGRSRADERFWQAAEDACQANGELLAGFHELEAAKYEHAEAQRRNGLTEARAKAAQFRDRTVPIAHRAAPPPTGPSPLDQLRKVVLGGQSSTADQAPPGPAAVAAATREAHRLYQSADYDGAARLLPPLLGQLDQLAAKTVAVAETTAGAYIAAAKLATKQADAALAWVTADRAKRFALDSGHPGLVGAATYQVACALLRAGYADDAEQVAQTGADDMASYVSAMSGRPNSARYYEALSVRGALLLLSAVLVARRGDGTAARAHLADAQHLAEQLTSDGNWLWTGFGATNVAIHDLAVQVELGDTKRAIQLGEVINTDAMPRVLTGRRSQVHLDLARAAASQANDSLAVLHLLESERVAAQSVSRNSVARSLLESLLARERRSATPGLRALVTRAEVLA